MTSTYLPHRSALSVLRGFWLFFAEFFTTFRLREHWVSLGLVAAGVSIVAGFLLGVYMVDFRNSFGLSSDQGFWWHAYRNRGPMEFVQWLFLATVAIFSATLSGLHFARGERKAEIFWLLVAISFALMLIEDSGDTRQVLGGYFRKFWGFDYKYVEGVFFGVTVTPIIFAFLRFWNVPFRFPQTRMYLLLGGGMYAFAALTSLFRWQDEFYLRLGTRLSDRFLGGEIPGFSLMDMMYEESLELLACSTFLAGVVMYWRLARSSNPGDEP